MLDSDKGYVTGFSEYVKFLESSDYSMEFFTEREALERYCQDMIPDVIIVAQYLLEQCRKESDFLQTFSGQIAVLAEEKDIERIDGRKVVYRYQPVDQLMKEILKLCAETWKKEKAGEYIRRRTAGIVSVYSPVGRCGKTRLTLAIGVALAKMDYRVLLLNFEEFSALMQEVGEEAEDDLSDLLYYYLSGNSALGLKAQTVLKEYRGMDYVPPAACIRDLRRTQVTKLIDLISQLGSVGGYDVILLDLSNIVEDVFKLLEASDMILVPTLQDERSRCKLRRFREYLTTADYRIHFDMMYEIPMEKVDGAGDIIQSREVGEILQILQDRIGVWDSQEFNEEVESHVLKNYGKK